jgi:hypothetical protein
MDQDREHLKLLSIFHYIVAALMGTCACVFIVYIVIGAVFVINPQAMGPPGQQPPPGLHIHDFHGGAVQGPPGAQPPPAFFGWMFIAFGTIPLLLGWGTAVFVLLAGRFLARRKHYTFCLVMAAIACLFMPFGTVLGIFTLIVLLRPSVKPLFDQPAG